MLHLRVVTPPALADRVLDYLKGSKTVTNIVHVPGAAGKPSGDVVLCDVAREEGSEVIAGLRELGVTIVGSIAADSAGSVSKAAKQAKKRAEGSVTGAIVWQQVAAKTGASSELSLSFVLFMVLATMIGAVGIINDSLILIIGAMVVAPVFGPLSALAVAVVERTPRLALRSLWALVVGFSAGILAAYGMTFVIGALGIMQAGSADTHREMTLFIANPHVFSVIVALLAGIAGMSSLTTAKSSALIGVLINVTTVPAAANIGVAAAHQNPYELYGALLQLAINLVTLFTASVMTLIVQRLAFVRRLYQSFGAWRPRRD